MIVRPAQQKDIPAIVEIVERCGIGVEGLDYSTWTGVLLVAERGGQVVGFMAALPGSPYAVVTEMGVLPEHQKGRAAVKLWEGMELILRSMGVRAWAAFIGEKRDVNDTMPKLGAVETGAGRMWLRSL
jgi:N-acetylglutamate synthase-like GNAT family acetyltransferase